MTKIKNPILAEEFTHIVNTRSALVLIISGSIIVGFVAFFSGPVKSVEMYITTGGGILSFELASVFSLLVMVLWNIRYTNYKLKGEKVTEIVHWFRTTPIRRGTVLKGEFGGLFIFILFSLAVVFPFNLTSLAVSGYPLTVFFKVYLYLFIQLAAIGTINLFFFTIQISGFFFIMLWLAVLSAQVFVGGFVFPINAVMGLLSVIKPYPPLTIRLFSYTLHMPRYLLSTIFFAVLGLAAFFANLAILGRYSKYNRDRT